MKQKKAKIAASRLEETKQKIARLKKSVERHAHLHHANVTRANITVKAMNLTKNISVSD